MWIYRQSLQRTLENTAMESGETLQAMEVPPAASNLVHLLSRTTISLVRGENSVQTVADYADDTSMQLGDFESLQEAEATLQDMAHHLGAVILQLGLPSVQPTSTGKG